MRTIQNAAQRIITRFPVDTTVLGFMSACTTDCCDLFQQLKWKNSPIFNQVGRVHIILISRAVFGPFFK